MSQLVPCPECQRHVRKTESRCPFCGQALSLSHLPPAVLPTRRLGRAATFAFGAGVVGAAALVGCSSDDDGGAAIPIYGAPAAGMGGMNAGGGPLYGAPPSGATNGGNLNQGGSAQPVYGAPAAGTGNQPIGGAAGAGGALTGGAAGEGNVGGGAALYGGPPDAGAGGVGGAR